MPTCDQAKKPGEQLQRMLLQPTYPLEILSLKSIALSNSKRKEHLDEKRFSVDMVGYLVLNRSLQMLH